MTLGETSEDRLVKLLLAGVPVGPDVLVGPGDDCAVVRLTGAKESLLLKTDCIVENIHYLPEHPPERVGWKALCRALSDIGAMGGEPAWALINIFSPADRPVEYWKGFYRGLAKAARRFGAGITGGETSRSPQAAVSISLVGRVRTRDVVLRSGGKPGDLLFVTGRLGGSLQGRHLDFVPRVKEGVWLARERFPSAMMDLSDGLSTDLPRLAAASQCAFELDLDALPRNRGCTTGQALADGEDYELLLAVPARRAERLAAAWKKAFPRLPLTRIGQLLPPDRPSTPLPRGFDHFSIASGPGKRRASSAE